MDSAVCVILRGEVDLATVPMLRAQLSAAAEGGANIIVDLGALQYIDASGLGALLDAHRMLARTGRYLALATVPPMTRRILGIIGLEQVLEAFPTAEAAAASFRDRRGP